MDDDLYSMDDVSRFYFRHPIVQRHCDNFVGSDSEAIQYPGNQILILILAPG